MGMFDDLSNSLGKAWDIVKKDGKLTADNIKAPMREIRRALLEADVCLPFQICKSPIDVCESKGQLRAAPQGGPAETKLLPRSLSQTDLNKQTYHNEIWPKVGDLDLIYKKFQ